MKGIYKIGIVAFIILTFVVISYAPLCEKNQKEDLTDYTCDELYGAISRDGKDGRFVKDCMSFRWVDRSILEDAKIYKKCKTRNLSAERFNYKSFR